MLIQCDVCGKTAMSYPQYCRCGGQMLPTQELSTPPEGRLTDWRWEVGPAGEMRRVERWEVAPGKIVEIERVDGAIVREKTTVERELDDVFADRWGPPRWATSTNGTIVEVDSLDALPYALGGSGSGNLAKGARVETAKPKPGPGPALSLTPGRRKIRMEE